MILFPLRRVLFFAVVVLLFLILGMCCYFEYQQINVISAAIEERAVILQRKKDSVRNYQERVTFYKTDEGIEHLAREQYNLTTSGDRVILLRNEQDRLGNPDNNYQK